MAIMQNTGQLTHIEARKRNSKKDVPKQRERRIMGKGNELRFVSDLTTENSFLLKKSFKKRGDKWKQNKKRKGNSKKKKKRKNKTLNKREI